jgi:flagellar L-ring protein precursor FlgH
MKYSLAAIIFALASISIAGATDFDDAKSKSIFTDIKACKVGDILTVLIVEDARASNKAKSSAKEEGKNDMTLGPGMGFLDFIPLWGYSADIKNEYAGDGQLEKAGSVRAKMTVNIIAVKENGDLVIEGNRVLSINADKETLFLSGVVRQRDVSPYNSIYSYQIADAQVSFKGKGASNDAARAGIITRIINWIF